MKNIIYTTTPNFELKYKLRNLYEVRRFENLDSDFKDWVLENYIRMIENPTKAESVFEQILISRKIKYEKQVFFKIGGKCYFLDFYIPEKQIAIEVDGSIHKLQRKYDSLRNKRFMQIGVHTIRITNEMAIKPFVIQYIEGKLQRRLK